MDASPPPGEPTLRSLWELGDERFAVLDADGRPQLANTARTRDLGWNPRTLVDRPLVDLVHPEDRQALTDGLADLDDTQGAVTALEVRLRATDGQYHDLTLRMQRSPTASVCLIAHDVTGERRAQRELDDSERRFRLAMEHAPTGMSLADLKGSWIRVNDALCRLLGRRREELIGYVVDEVTHPDHLDRNDDGEPLDAIGQLVDITERNRTEARLRATVQELQRANKVLENLVANAVKFRHAERSPVVALDVERSGASWELMTTDNGRGFEEQDEEAIFERFGRTGGGERVESAGVGLATCRQIVERHGARSVRSRWTMGPGSW